MKLRRKVNSFHLLLLGIIFPILVLCNYLLFNYIINKNVKENLGAEQQRIIAYVNENDRLPISSFIFSAEKISNQVNIKPQFKDTIFTEQNADDVLKSKLLNFSLDAEESRFKITLEQNIIQLDKSIWLIAALNATIFLLLFLGLYFINRRVYTWLWQPFFATISDLKNFNVSTNDHLQFQKTEVEEFEQFNHVISDLITQTKRDYQNLKEFNQNISHEIQTPLTIVRNKVVSLLESKNLDTGELNRLEAIYREINKLSKIGKSLTLISRIENQEFKNFDDVDIYIAIKNILNNLEEIINFKNLDVDVNLEPTTVECDYILMDILLTNLIKNAIQHNKQEGFINIQLKNKELMVLNSGVTSELVDDKIFNRFERGNSKSDSLGLGLAISQKICEIYNYDLMYGMDKDNYRFTVKFQ